MTDPLSCPANTEDDPHAVRWGRRVVVSLFGEPDYGKWHWTHDGKKTMCGVKIPKGVQAFFPDSDSGMGRVNCKRCLRRMRMKANGK